LDIKRVGGTEVDAVIHGKEIYLSVRQLFSFLKIKNELSEDLESISGYFIDPESEYRIDRIKNQILFGGKASGSPLLLMLARIHATSPYPLLGTFSRGFTSKLYHFPCFSGERWESSS
ncbi:MAG TPA: hypothetical protein PLA80_13775, partial [Synergistaceae bacterium]|nr:hypothetical protein [Synergistaceae bacterium]